MTQQQLNKNRHELRRGSLVLAVLMALREQAQYGYSLRQQLIKAGLEVDEGTLYPLLRRLENQALLRSEWRLGEPQGRRRRYYQCTDRGLALSAELWQEWRALEQVLHHLEANK